MGINLLFRFHGSAVIRTLPYSICGLTLYLVFHYIVIFDGIFENSVILHPYVLSVIIGAYSFMIIFRVNFSYGRYWEAYGHVHQMHSKLLDGAGLCAAFHFQQSSLYDRPKCLSDDGGISGESMFQKLRSRRGNATQTEEVITQTEEVIVELQTKFELGTPRLRKKFREGTSDNGDETEYGSTSIMHSRPKKDRQSTTRFITMSPSASTEDRNPANNPSPYLQELVHLYSLISAVALATLRCDVEHCSIPISRYIPGAPWPPIDPDTLPGVSESTILFALGFERNVYARTRYNAKRPLGVLSGIGEEEASALRSARGPSAVVSMASLWLNEFIIREFTTGKSFGGVAPPIVSRIFQYNSDGMVGYNQARKVAYCPFPFPHAQLCTYFSSIVLVVIALLVRTFIESVVLGAPIVVFTLMALLGIQEVARELERPFKNTPNDLPLVTMQAQFNEALLATFVGYHPDAHAWWSEEHEILT